MEPVLEPLHFCEERKKKVRKGKEKQERLRVCVVQGPVDGRFLV
jgi:hypothetical protein